MNAIFDGLNLVAKEAPLVNVRDGVLSSPRTPARTRSWPRWASTVNPFDVEGQAEALYEALTMPEAERRRRSDGMRAHVREHDLDAWLEAQLAQLAAVAPGTRLRSEHGRALARRHRGRRAHGGRRRQAASPPCGRAGVGADGARDAERLRSLPKGDALVTAELAGVLAAKRTSELIPLCHQLPLSVVDVSVEVGGEGVEITAAAETTAQTGVEMEALVAASIAALTVYDMAKAIDGGMVVSEVRLVEKTKAPA